MSIILTRVNGGRSSICTHVPAYKSSYSIEAHDVRGRGMLEQCKPIKQFCQEEVQPYAQALLSSRASLFLIAMSSGHGRRQGRDRGPS